jgi:RNA polymerase sigma-70 factor, ECF subfamily
MDDAFQDQLIALLPRLRRFALGLTTDPDRADDLVQAGCERALARRQQWQAGTRLDSWLFRILQNLWIDQLRSPQHRTESDEEAMNELADRDWDQDIEARLTLEQVLQAVAQLPPPMRAVLMLVCVEGQAYKEAAATLELPVGTVMSRLSRARLELHRRLHGAQATETDHAQLH